jgi:PAS domain S-box-containing protein
MARPARVLLVDDNEEDRRLARHTLASDSPDLVPLEISGPRDFARALDQASFDAVITDSCLAWSTGLAVMAEVRRRFPDVPVIMFTREATEQGAAEGLKAGLDDYVAKSPDQAGRLPRAVRAALRRSQERRVAQEALTLHRKLFDGVPIGLYRCTPEGKILDANPALAQLMGCGDPRTLVGTHLVEWAADVADRPRWKAAMEREGIVRGFELRLKRRDGSLFWARESARTVLDSTGRLLYYEGAVEDISDGKQTEEALRRSEEQLRQAQKMEAIGRLAGGVAHDFNNLLTAILGFSDLLRGQLAPSDPRLSHVNEIHQAAERAGQLTRQLLTFSRKQVLQPKVIDLNAVLGDMDKMLGRLIGENIDLVTLPAPDLGRVRVDRSQIEQAILNLALNARDAMPEGGRLTLETQNVTLDETYCREHPSTRPGPHVMLAVSDSGMGMSEEIRSHLFEPFFTTKEPGRGTGLGLPTVYGVVKQSGGHIGVYSQPGQGSSFKIYFPRVEEAAAGVADPPLRGARGGSETILLVEDSDVVRKLAVQVLRTAGYAVLETQAGPQAISAADGHAGPIHLLLTDLVMPEMGGQDLALYLRAARPGLRVLYMSGYTENAAIHQGRIEAGSFFMAKPFTPASLVRRVREVLDSTDRRSA